MLPPFVSNGVFIAFLSVTIRLFFPALHLLSPVDITKLKPSFVLELFLIFLSPSSYFDSSHGFPSDLQFILFLQILIFLESPVLS